MQTIPAATLPATPLAERRLRIYVAAPLGQAHVARMIGARLTAEGYDVVSRWTDRLDAATAPDAPPVSRELLAAIHRENERELAAADLVIAWTAEGNPKATYGEIATALSRGVPVVWLQGPNGEGGNAYDTDPLVTAFRRHDYGEEPARSAILAEVARLAVDLAIDDAEAHTTPLTLAVPPSLLVALANLVRPGEPASFAAMLGIAGEEHPDVVRVAVHTLCSLGVLEATDPGPNGEARWRRRNDLVDDLQRENARLREQCTAVHAGERAFPVAEITTKQSPDCPRAVPCATVGFHAADECAPFTDGQPLGVAVRDIAAGENVIAGSMVAPVRKAAPTLHLTADEAAALLTGPAIVYRPVAALPPDGYMQALRGGSWEWSPDGGFDQGVFAVPCPWGKSGSRVMLTEPWRSWEERCIDEQCGDDHVCSAHCHQVYVAYQATPRAGYRPVPDKARITYLDESTPLERNRHLLGPWQPAETMPPEYVREPAGRTLKSVGVRCTDDGWQWVIAVGEAAP